MKTFTISFTLTILVLVWLMGNPVFADELRFRTYENGQIRQGTVREWGTDAYKIQSYGPQGWQETIIRVPDTNPLGVYSEPPISPYQPLPMWEME